MSLDELNQQLDHGLRVYQYFLGPHIKPGKYFKSLFGHDGRDSFNLFQRGDGHVAWCDHAMMTKRSVELYQLLSCAADEVLC